MTKTKREKLEELDTDLLDAMSDLMKAKDYDGIKSLGTVVTYLKNNQVLTPPKEKSTMHDKIRDAIDE